MQWVWLLFLGFPMFLNASTDCLFSEDEDSTLYHHVNVITGDLNLSFQDVQIQGAVPQSLVRTYTSSDCWKAPERTYRSNKKEVYYSWVMEEGWDFMPHLVMRYTSSDEDRIGYFTIKEKNGSIMHYMFEKEWGQETIFEPARPAIQNLSNLSARRNPQNNRLHRSYKGLILYLADGGVRFYKHASSQDCYLLMKEVTPDQYETHYTYHKERRLESIRHTSPQGRVTFSSVHFTLLEKATDDKPFYFEAHVSTGQKLGFRSVVHKNLHYLSQVESNCGPKEFIDYARGKKERRYRLHSFHLADQPQLVAHYYQPSNEKERKRSLKKGDNKRSTDKIQKLEAPIGANGEWLTLASFTYFSHHTDVRDVDQLLIRYHHDDRCLTSIDYFDQRDQLAYSVKFFWEGDRLKAKTLLDAHQSPLFSRVFTYDAAGNVSEEAFFGNLTGKAKEPFVLKGNGLLEKAEVYRRFYVYDQKTHLLLEEREDDGPKYTYTYKPNTTLLTSKLTWEGNTVRKREFSSYNDDNLLIEEILDDGTALDKKNLSSVTTRQTKYYTLSPTHGLPIELRETSRENGQERLVRRTEYAYSSQNRVIAQTLYDATNTFCYTIHTDYNLAGQILSKTTPSGYTNVYTYGPQGELLSSKEEGALQKEYTYNLAGLPISYTEIDTLGNRRSTYSHYDAKGRLIRHISPEGHVTIQRYDDFGHCIETFFPSFKDSQENICEPSVQFTYDPCGNISSTTSEQRGTTQTTYNTFRKPTEIIQADGTRVEHIYSLNGLLIQTIYPDGTTIHDTYDYAQRKTSEQIISSQGNLLTQELWTYDTFHLLSHIDGQGLKCEYLYDGSSRLIQTRAADRMISYEYNASGLLEKESQGEVSQITLYDAAGREKQRYQQDSQGRQENVMTFLYDEEGLKIQATRLTSQGEATDLFEYDPRRRLCRHTDPLGASSEFLYEEILNELNQIVLQKTTIDPIGNRTVATYDALGHLVSTEKQDPGRRTVSEERTFYDVAGNQTKRQVTIYDQTIPLREITTEWEYDVQGRLILEKEHPNKATSYSYTPRGFLASKTLPSGIVLTYDYDGLGRLLELRSSDHSVHYIYHYGQGKEPLRIDDLVQGTSLQRSYNVFGELMQETNPCGLIFQWTYDDQGRCTQFTLPDQSQIHYDYEGAHLTRVQRYDQKVLYEHQYLNFDPNGHVMVELLANHSQLLSTRDLLERPSSQTTRLLHHTISYGPSGLVLTQTNTLLSNKTYAYDPLNQLIQEEEISHSFDSIGNPTNAQVNEYNQILESQDTLLQYDLDGNPVERVSPDKTLKYTYDALGRLTSINDTTYSYDPLSRLLKKETNEEVTLYLYDQTQEIGSCSANGQIRELKVLGLGIQGDIGAAVAIELEKEVYIPLHDFCGHIIALAKQDGTLLETYPTDAFGKSSLSSPSRNPWRFSSKRSEGDLIFFGKRFYDPSLGRFLTPDPAGFKDGPNLYIYVLNNPLSRLDLFGLNSRLFHPISLFDDISIEIKIRDIPTNNSTRAVVEAIGRIGTTSERYIVISDSLHKIQYTPEEQQAGSINILNYLRDLVPNEGAVPGIASFGNGMFHSGFDHQESCESIMKEMPEDCLFISAYNPSLEWNEHHFQVARQQLGVITPVTAHISQLLTTLTERAHAINPDLILIYFSHSQGGRNLSDAIDLMTPDQKTLLKQHLYSFSYGPLKPVSSDHTLFSVNYYSKKDYVTKMFAKDYLDDASYNIEFLDCKTPWYDRVGWVADHAFLGETYKQAQTKDVNAIKKTYKLHDSKTR